MNLEVPDFYKYIKWYNLNDIGELYNFMQELFTDDSVNIEDYPDIKAYYEVLYDNIFKEEPDLVVVNYVAKKLKNRLIAYKFAHTTYIMAVVVKKELYYYWHYRKE